MSARPIGARLDSAALARLHFSTLSPDEVATAIRRMAAEGHGEHTIAHATALSVEHIRRVLSEGGTP